MTLSALILMAMAVQVQVHAGGDDLVLTAVDMPLLLADGVFSADDLDAASDVLQAAGIDAAGRFSLFAAETSQGLSVILLLDPPMDGDPGNTTPISLGVETLLSGGDDILVNYEAGGWWYEYDLPEGLLGTGTLQWVHGVSAAAIAWTGLEAISTIDLSLFDVGGIQDTLKSPVLQILDAGKGWSVVHEVDFDDNDAIFLAMDVVTIPTPGAMMLALCLMTRRRRR